MRERFREAPRKLFEVSGDAFGCRFRSKRGPWEGTITPKTDKAVKKTSDGERTTIIFGKFENIDVTKASHGEDFSHSLFKTFS